MKSVCYHRRYTLIEMMLVILILGMISGVVLSRISGTPKRLLVESALSEIRNAFSTVAMSARATGQVKGLIFEPDNHRLSQCIVPDDLEVGWRPPVINPEEQGGRMEASDPESYELSESIIWQDIPESSDFDGINGIRYLFFPDGQASGPDVFFELYEREFYWQIDRALGTVTIYERQ